MSTPNSDQGITTGLGLPVDENIRQHLKPLLEGITYVERSRILREILSDVVDDLLELFHVNNGNDAPRAAVFRIRFIVLEQIVPLLIANGWRSARDLAGRILNSRDLRERAKGAGGQRVETLGPGNIFLTKNMSEEDQISAFEAFWYRASDKVRAGIRTIVGADWR